MANKSLSFILIAGSLSFIVHGWAETSGTATASLTQGSTTLAVIAGKSITVDNFKAEMARRQGTFDADRKEELLDSIVRSELLFAAARSAGYENDPEVIAVVKHAMVGKYLRDNLDPKLGQLKASDQEIEAYYQSHQSDFGTHAMVHAAIIKIAVSPKISSEKKAALFKRAESIRVEALALEPGIPAFGGIAVKYSEDQDSRYRGGDIGWLQVGMIDSRFDSKVTDAILALKAPGQISPVVTAADGYYIVKLIETKGATVKPLAAVKDGVRYQIIQEKKMKIEDDLIEQLKGRIPVTVNSELLNSLLLTAEVKKQSGPPALPKR